MKATKDFYTKKTTTGKIMNQILIQTFGNAHAIAQITTDSIAFAEGHARKVIFKDSVRESVTHRRIVTQYIKDLGKIGNSETI